MYFCTAKQKDNFIKLKYLFLSIIILVFINATKISTSNKKELNYSKNGVVPLSFPLEIKNTILYLPKNFIAFKEAVAFKESQGKYNSVNTLGYLGKYQFGIHTLKRFKIHNKEAFLKSPKTQEKAFVALCKVNKWILRKDISRSVGKTINGIKITESGILAAAHLSGAGNVKKYLRSNGARRFSDAYGASIQLYLKRFAGYDLSTIKADRNATI
ncbi:peptidoglycan-binding protein LysM [Polaribacter tangerinus]|uniref:peptidoglycan-binding protein LysM n=1 Tax=Polaribacter tangerinus TaxID=1920034 RepID=UPI000B4A8756|nr:peptidoglycan-binding protein LysM [Polaribacter tangerinus]